MRSAESGVRIEEEKLIFLQFEIRNLKLKVEDDFN
jgi:hypothetical protein